MVVSAHDAARELRARLPRLGNAKLHKLLYYSQGTHLARTGSPLFTEAIEAWANGPVVGDLWRSEKWNDPPIPPNALDEVQLETVGLVVLRYGGFTGSQLIDLTHRERPWREASKRTTNNTVISVPDLEAYFSHVEPLQDRRVALSVDRQADRWLDEQRRAVADGSARVEASSADEIRRVIAEAEQA